MYIYSGSVVLVTLALQFCNPTPKLGSHLFNSISYC